MENGWSNGGSLYSSRGGGYHGNPSVTGDHVKEEIVEVTRWANQHLGQGGYTDSLITDLPSDMADGITLIRLVHAVSDELLPKHFTNPMMRVQKLENLQLCIKYLRQKGVQLAGVHAEDIAAGNIKSILAVCNSLKRHYTGGPSPRTSHGVRGHHRLSFSSLDKDDIAVLSWLEKTVHREVPDYSVLYDGKVLCDLVNELHQGAISQQALSSVSSAEERLQLAFDSAQKVLFIFPSTSLAIIQISSGSEDTKLRGYLQQCKQLHERQTHRKGLLTVLSQPASSSSGSSSHSKQPPREKAFESLRTSSTGRRESREASKIASRTYEGIQQKRGREGGGALHSSTGHLATKPHPHSSKRPLTDVYVSGASSYTDLSSTREDHADIVRSQRPAASISKHSSTSSDSLNKGKKKKSGFGRHHSMEPLLAAGSGGLGRSWPRGRGGGGYESDGPLSRSSSQGQMNTPFSELARGSSVASSIESFTDTPPLRAPSAESAMSGDDVIRISGLEERMGLLATQFLYERHDMFKQIHHALVKERKKRVAAEKRLKELEKTSRQFIQLYNARLLDLAKEVSVLRGELTSVGRGGLEPTPTVTMEIQHLKQQVAELSERCSHMTSQVSSPPQSVSPRGPQTTTANHTLFMKKRASSDLTPSSGPYLRGSAASFKKLSNFFGEEPPRLLDIHGFLEELKYTHLLPTFTSQGITLPELRCMDESSLEQLGVPLGPRVRILSELRKLEPLNDNDIVI